MISLQHKILLIDDDDVDREAIRRLLDADYDIHEASTGEQARKLAAAHQFACMIVDYRLPDMDGTDLIARIDQPELPAIFLTGQGSEHVATRAFRRGATDYLTKRSLDLERLNLAVQNAIEKRTLRTKLRQQSEAMAQFAYAAAHDLRAPLSRIAQYTQLVREDAETALSPTSSEDLESVVRISQQMMLLVKDLLSYGTTGQAAAPHEVHSLKDVVRDVLDSLKEQVRATRAEVRVEDLPVVFGDRTALHQVFQNLLANGLKFHAPDQAPHLHVSAERAGDFWHFRVRDRGLGIAPKFQDEVFLPLRRLHGEQVEGSGLGLALCRQRIEHHGGKIWIESQEGAGATFHFTLPAWLPAGNAG